MKEIPAEVYMEKPNIENDLKYSWVIYQPDVSGQPDYCSGKHWDKERAERDAFAALRQIHRQQGFIE